MKQMKKVIAVAALMLSLLVVCAAGALVTDVNVAVPGQRVITAEVSGDFA